MQNCARRGIPKFGASCFDVRNKTLCTPGPRRRVSCSRDRHPPGGLYDVIATCGDGPKLGRPPANPKLDWLTTLLLEQDGYNYQDHNMVILDQRKGAGNFRLPNFLKNENVPGCPFTGRRIALCTAPNFGGNGKPRRSLREPAQN